MEKLRILIFSIFATIMCILFLLSTCTKIKAPIDDLHIDIPDNNVLTNSLDNVLPDNSTFIEDYSQQNITQYEAKIVVHFTSMSSGEVPENMWYMNKMQYDWPENRILHTFGPSELLLESLEEEPLATVLVVFQPDWGKYMDKAAMAEIRGKYPDMLIVGYFPRGNILDQEMRANFDLIIAPDYVAVAKTIPDQAQSMGAEYFFYYNYSYENYLYSYEEYLYPYEEYFADIANRLFKESCEQVGLKYSAKEFDKPEPSNILYDATYTSMKEDVQAQVDKYGTAAAFYSPDIQVQSELAYAALSENAICVPFCWYNNMSNPTGVWFGSDYELNYPKANKDISEFIAEKGGTGRFATWPVSIDMLSLEAASNYALAYADGNNSLKHIDKDFLAKCFQEAMAKLGYPDHQVHINTYDEYGDNCFFISEDYIIY